MNVALASNVVTLPKMPEIISAGLKAQATFNSCGSAIAQAAKMANDNFTKEVVAPIAGVKEVLGNSFANKMAQTVGN